MSTRLSEAYVADLALLTTDELVAKYGPPAGTHQSARTRRGIAAVSKARFAAGQTVKPWHARLGKEPDPVIAADLGYSRSAVSKARILRGIAPFVFPEVAPVVPEWTRLLGIVPDREIGRRFGVSCTAVSLARNRLGIPCSPTATWRRPAPTPRVVVPRPVVVAATRPAPLPPRPPVQPAPVEPYRPVARIETPRTVRLDVLRAGLGAGCACEGDAVCRWCR